MEVTVSEPCDVIRVSKHVNFIGIPCWVNVRVAFPTYWYWIFTPVTTPRPPPISTLIISIKCLSYYIVQIILQISMWHFYICRRIQASFFNRTFFVIWGWNLREQLQFQLNEKFKQIHNSTAPVNVGIHFHRLYKNLCSPSSSYWIVKWVTYNRRTI